MKKVINKELNKTETEAHGATAMTNTKNTEKETATIEQPIVNRMGEMTYIDTKNIQSLSSLRLGEDTTQQSKDRKFNALVKSIIVEGVLTPLVVRKTDESDTYSLIDGSRRLAAAKIIGVEQLPIIIYDESEDKAELLSIIANANQKKASLIELGMAYKRLLESGAYGSNKELADALAISESTVGTRINNLNLDKNIIEDLIANSSITDQKILKAIRTMEKTDEEGQSKKQWEVYSHIKEANLNRKDALEYIKEQRGTVETKRNVKLSSSKMIGVEVDTSVLDEARVSEIKKLIAQIEEIRQGTEA